MSEAASKRLTRGCLPADAFEHLERTAVGLVDLERSMIERAPRRAVVGRAAPRALIFGAATRRADASRAYHDEPGALAIQATYFVLLDLAVGGEWPCSPMPPPTSAHRCPSTECTSRSDRYRIAALV